MKLKELLPEVKILKAKTKEELQNFAYNWDERGWEEAIDRCYEENLPIDLRNKISLYTDLKAEIDKLLEKYFKEYNIEQDIF